jgi:hypothetical protein
VTSTPVNRTPVSLTSRIPDRSPQRKAQNATALAAPTLSDSDPGQPANSDA